MKISIKATNIELNPPAKEFIEKKINSLERYSKIFQDEKYYNYSFGQGKPKVEAWVEVGKRTRHHRKGPVYFAECQIRFPGKNLIAVSEGEDLIVAVNEVKDDLQRQLKKYKQKPVAKIERGARKAKEDLRLSPSARSYRKGRIKEEGV